MEKKTGSAAIAKVVEEQRPKKKKFWKFVIVLILLLLFAGLGVCAALCYIHDYYGVRSQIVAFFITQDDQYRSKLMELDERELELDEREHELSEVAAQQAATAEQQQKEQARLDALFADLETRESNLSSRITAFDNNVMDYDKLVETIVEMDTENAAVLLETVWPTADAAKLLSRMEPKDAAGILDEMTAEGARIITEMLIDFSE